MKLTSQYFFGEQLSRIIQSGAIEFLAGNLSIAYPANDS